MIWKFPLLIEILVQGILKPSVDLQCVKVHHIMVTELQKLLTANDLLVKVKLVFTK